MIEIEDQGKNEDSNVANDSEISGQENAHVDVELLALKSKAIFILFHICSSVGSNRNPVQFMGSEFWIFGWFILRFW